MPGVGNLFNAVSQFLNFVSCACRTIFNNIVQGWATFSFQCAKLRNSISKYTFRSDVFTSISSPISLRFSQNQDVLQKKKGLHFDFIYDFPIFLPKSGLSLKKKKVRKRVFEKYSRRRVPHKITSRANLDTRARGCRPLVYAIDFLAKTEFI